MGPEPSKTTDHEQSYISNEPNNRFGLANDKLTPNDFIRMNLLGVGNFGKVWQVKKKDDDQIFAMKILKKSDIIANGEIEHIRTERNILREIIHPFIVKMHYAFQTPQKLYIVMEYINGGELFYHLKREHRFSNQRSKLYAAQIVLALEHLHSLDIVYRDLKPENIMLTAEGNIIITDFGLSKMDVTDATSASTICGTAEYLAPEVIRQRPYGKAVDWWSLGTLLFEMLTGLPPFYSPDATVMYKRILRSELTIPPFIDKNCESLLRGLLERDPAKRLGSGPEDGMAIRNHPYFQDIDWDRLFRKEYDMPFKPQISNGKVDTSNFDSRFTSTPIKESLPDHQSNIPSDVFEGFSYREDNQLDKAKVQQQFQNYVESDHVDEDMEW
eukprot:TRINITY_DN2651_c0_g1_i1.p1 TRINITY_DN2651_c0_g1~~TRINITY_DN2651_c0_g1_i1.p1  ORF type:complete len:385 (+),score=93.46 TRINITY_DN2651_c0_g1_i1:341-1495(+)